MARYPANLGRFVARSRSGKETFRFNPSGKVSRGDKSRKNPFDDFGNENYSARFFVGFNVGEEPVYSMDYLVNEVRKGLKSLGMGEDSTFVYQKGVYTHSGDSSKGTVVQEDSAQVIIFNMGLGVKEFEKNMIELTEKLCSDMGQESIILEFQKDGIQYKVGMMTPA